MRLNVWCRVGYRVLDWQDWWHQCPCCGCKLRNYNVHKQEDMEGYKESDPNAESWTQQDLIRNRKIIAKIIKSKARPQP
jgi:hypothetical protein